MAEATQGGIFWLRFQQVCGLQKRQQKQTMSHNDIPFMQWVQGATFMSRSAQGSSSLSEPSEPNS